MTPHSDSHTESALRAKLHEDGLSPAEIDAHLASVQRLSALPHTPPANTSQLIARLQAQAMRPSLGSRWWSQVQTAQLYLLLRAQLRVVKQDVWAASALVMALGAVVTVATYRPQHALELVPLTLVAPLIAAAGVAYLYGPMIDPALEIELATITSPRLVLLARLVLVFGFNLALGVAGSAVVSLFSPDVSFWPLVVAWLAPMTFLSVLAFSFTVFVADSLFSLGLSIGLWCLIVVKRLDATFPLPDLLSAEMWPWAWSVALLLMLAALWSAGREEHWLNKALR